MRRRVPRGLLGLFAVAGTEPFYRRFGFEAQSGTTGMFQVAPMRIDPEPG